MKILDVLFKDVRQSFRSIFAVIFMFAVPILVVAMFYFIFGGMPDEESPFQIPHTSVEVVNLDEGDPAFSQGLSAGTGEDLVDLGIDLAQVNSMGDLLVRMLESEEFIDILSVSEGTSIPAARSSVDEQEIGVAIFIPQDFTRALVDPDETAVLELYHDPDLTLGPGIVKSVLSQFLDYTIASKIGISVVNDQMLAQGLDPAPLQQEILMQFLAADENLTGNQNLVELQPLEEKEQVNPTAQFVGIYMGAMMIFYAFYTGTASAESILREEERGTLARLFTTPTRLWTILGGKFAAAFVTVVIQVTSLLIFAALVFGVDWGDPWRISLAALGTVLAASAFGIFIISLIKNSKQGGIIFGGVVTTTGMMGMSSVFAMNSPSAARLTQTLSLIVPQGWAMNALRLATEEASFTEMLPVITGLLAWSVVLLVIGLLRFRRRFA